MLHFAASIPGRNHGFCDALRVPITIRVTAHARTSQARGSTGRNHGFHDVLDSAHHSQSYSLCLHWSGAPLAEIMASMMCLRCPSQPRLTAYACTSQARGSRKKGLIRRPIQPVLRLRVVGFLFGGGNVSMVFAGFRTCNFKITLDLVSRFDPPAWSRAHFF